MRRHVLSKLFEPRSVVLLCEDIAPDSAAHTALWQLQSGGFVGELSLVCPKDIHEDLLRDIKLPRYRTLAELPRSVDLAVLVIPTAAIVAKLHALAELGVQAVLLLCSDHGERERRRPGLSAEIRDVADTHGIVLLGPDSLGVMRPSVGLCATVSRSIVKSGDVALVTQSGGFSSALLDWAQSNGFGFSLVATPGGVAGIDFGGLLDYLSVDSETRSVLLYVEQVSDARSFLSSLRATARAKPVIILKSGRANADEVSAGGAASVLADTVFDAAVARAGAVRVDTVHQLFTAARALLAGTRVRGSRLGILSNASGPALMAVDHAARRQLPLTGPSNTLLTQVQRVVAGARLLGPCLDIPGDATPDDYQQATDALLADRDIDAVLVMLTPQRAVDPIACAMRVIESARKFRKPVLACWMGESLVSEARDAFAEAGVLQFSSPERCLDAFTYLAAYERHQTVLVQAPASQGARLASDLAGAQLMIEEAISRRRTQLTSSESRALLSAFRIPVQHSINVGSAHDALVAAETLGLPVSLHINTSEVLGGAEPLPRREAAHAAEVRSAYRDVLEEMQARFPTAHIGGVGVQRLAETEGGRAFVLGIAQDVTFGPIIMLGPAGTEIGGGQNLAVTLPPLNSFLCRDLIHRALGDSRGQSGEGEYEEPLLDLLMRVSEISCMLPEVQQLLIHPLRLHAGELCIEDVSIRVAAPPTSTRRYGHMAIHPYPTDMVRRWQLPSGQDVVIRPLRPEDSSLEQAFVDGLSAESRYNRFMYRMDKLTPGMLARFTQIDYDREMAIAVVLIDRKEEIRILAVARYVVNPDAQSCEFALTVGDDVQRQGIGRQIMQTLMRAARDRGLKIIEGDVLASNSRMLRFCEGLGFRLTRNRDDAELMIVRRSLS